LTSQTAHKMLHDQRARGAISTEFGAFGLVRHREEGALKLRMPRLSQEAILINTGGGIAGGDHYANSFTLTTGAKCTITSQAAERVYRSMGPAAEITNDFTLSQGAELAWLPQETILFEGAVLKRRMTARLETESRLLAVESIVLGRSAMGEVLQDVQFTDHWDVWRNGRLLHSERLRLSGAPPKSLARLRGCKAFATVLLVAQDAEIAAQALARYSQPDIGISCWNGKLIARLVAEDGFQLRKSLKTVLSACLSGRQLPRVWEM
jgi:urease accessory protein